MSKRPQKHTYGDSTGVEISPTALDQQSDKQASTYGKAQGSISALPATQAGSHPYLEEVISHTSHLMIALDEQFHILDFNPAAGKVLGWSTKKAIGRHCTELLRCQNLNKIVLCGTSSCPLVRVQQLKQPLPNEELLLGDTSEVLTNVTPVDKGDGTFHTVFTACDISALKVANRIRANFVSMVSHELRTPLNSVHGFIDLLIQGHMGSLTREQLKYLGYTQEGVQQLISIVEDILFMTRSDVGQFEMKQQEINFRVLARQVVGSMEPQARKAGVVINKDIVSPSPLLFADPQRMKQVLNNLVTNAIKFTPPEGTVTIQARPYDDDFVLISVVDTGYGIPCEDRQHVFERFYQSNHNQQSRMGGYGLGLSIAKLIVEQHGGTIDFDTILDKGTTFYFTAPVFKGQKS